MRSVVAFEATVRGEPDVPIAVFGDISESGSTELRKALPSPLFEDWVWLFGTLGLCLAGEARQEQEDDEKQRCSEWLHRVPEVEAAGLEWCPI